MKKNMVFAAAICLISFGAKAQVTSTNTGGFIVKAGANFANVSTTDDGQVDDSKTLTSFHAGFVFDLPLSGGVSLQPGLMFTGKGAKTQRGEEGDNIYYRASSNPLYIELPVNFVGKVPLGGSANLLLGAGPYAAVGVGGKNKVKSRILGIENNNEKSIEFSNDDPTTSNEENSGYGKLKRFDYGLNALAGIDFGIVMVTANYGYGLAKINSGTNNRDDDNNKHRVLGVSLGFKL